MNEFFAKAYNSGVIENLNLLFEKEAKIVKQDGTVITGQDSINREHGMLLQIGGKMTSINKHCIEFEDIALLRAEWKIQTVDKNQNIVEIKGSSSEIVRKQKNGTWLYIVDAPFGATQ
jgi:ketosteroid isomerase-like protein